MSKPLEKEIENAILYYLECLPECFAWKCNNHGVYDVKRKKFRLAHSRFQIKGVADILGIFKGQFLAIEVKRPGNKLTPHQEIFLEQVKLHGGLATVAYSVEDVENFLQEVESETID